MHSTHFIPRLLKQMFYLFAEADNEGKAQERIVWARYFIVLEALPS